MRGSTLKKHPQQGSPIEVTVNGETRSVGRLQQRSETVATPLSKTNVWVNDNDHKTVSYTISVNKVNKISKKSLLKII